MVEQLTKESFNQVISGKLPVIVDFWAEWCGPCKELGPVFDKVSNDFKGRLHFAKLNVEEFQDIAAKQGIMGIPCMILFRNGQEVDRIVGAMPEASLRGRIEQMLGS